MEAWLPVYLHMCVLVWDRESMCVCVCVWKWEGMCERESWSQKVLIKRLSVTAELRLKLGSLYIENTEINIINVTE